jgi:hypothetical protein
MTSTPRPVERTAYVVAALLAASGLVHLAVLVIGGGSWQGPLSLRKAVTFGLSFGLTLANVAWIASFVRLRERTRTLLLGGFTAACVVETSLVSMQAWRGVPSHFNMETRFDAAVAQSLAVGGVTLVALIVVLTVAALRDRTPMPSSLRVAIGAGLIALVGAQVAGGVMIGTGVRLVIAGTPASAYATGGWLKPVHAVLMHGILVLPLLALLLAKTPWSERRRTDAVWIGVALYALGVAAALVMALGHLGASRS